MFEASQEQLSDALSENGGPIAVDDVHDIIDGSAVKVESVLNQFCEVETVDGESFVVGIEGGPSYDTEREDEGDDEEAAETAAEEAEFQADTQPTAETDSVEGLTTARSWDADDDLDLYEVNGIKIQFDPEKELAGEPTGDDWYGLPILTNGHAGVPNETTPYFPVEVGGNRDSEEVMGQVLGVMNRPLLFEGEAGTGKNSAIARAASATSRVTQRTNFGADVSVFDVVGEKEIADGSTYFIIGDVAKAAMFGHYLGRGQYGLWRRVVVPPRTG